MRDALSSPVNDAKDDGNAAKMSSNSPMMSIMSIQKMRIHCCSESRMHTALSGTTSTEAARYRETYKSSGENE